MTGFVCELCGSDIFTVFGHKEKAVCSECRKRYDITEDFKESIANDKVPDMVEAIDLNVIEKHAPNAILVKEFDSAFLGLTEVEPGKHVACYDMEECIGILTDTGAFTYKEAVAKISTVRDMGEQGDLTPLFIYIPE